MRFSLALADFGLSASMVNVRYLVLTRPLLPFASCFCRMPVYSADVVEVVPPAARSQNFLRTAPESTLRFRNENWTWMEAST